MTKAMVDTLVGALPLRKQKGPRKPRGRGQQLRGDRRDCRQASFKPRRVASQCTAHQHDALLIGQRGTLSSMERPGGKNMEELKGGTWRGQPS